MTNRRVFLKSGALLAAGSLVGTKLMASASDFSSPLTTTKKFGLQTYSLGQELSADVPAGMARIARAGYSELELAGYSNGKMGNYTMAEYKKLADDAGLKITGSHLSPSIRQYTSDNFAQFDEFWKKAVADHVVLGVTTMVQPSMPTVTTHDEAKLVGEVFNRAGKIAKDAGILWGYHNHSGEFQRIVSAEQKAAAERQQAEMAARMQQGGGAPQGGAPQGGAPQGGAPQGGAPRGGAPQGGAPQGAAARSGAPQGGATQGAAPMMMGRGAQGDYIEKLFIDNTDPELVMFELDVYWAAMGQQDPCQWLSDYPNRFKLIHVKDKWIIGASGLMNWENIFKKSYEIGIKTFYVEIEGGGDGRTQFEAAEASAQYLAAAPFVK